jgi:hypothetical protein
MKDGKRGGQPSASIPRRILGSLREALATASRDTAGNAAASERTELLPREQPTVDSRAMDKPAAPAGPAASPNSLSAAEALREAKSPPRRNEAAKPATRVVLGGPKPSPAALRDDGPRTQVVRGKPKVTHGAFHQDPVVGWLVVVGGLGLGAFRPIYEGNNAVGRNASQRIPIDFGDNTISAEEQAYIRYDSMDRSFLFVPNLAKANVVAVNNRRPTGAVKLEPMDMITMGCTQLAFVPFCGEDFDWSELADLKE